MKILVLMDSFKGSLTSTEAGEAVKRGILSSGIAADVSVYPFADGGEGTLDAFLKADPHGRAVGVRVFDPLGRPVEASYGVLSDQSAVIEIAQAAGLCLLSEAERDPLLATTRGVGQLIKHAATDGLRDFIITLGGSATNDCGIGMLSVLGVRILDQSGQSVHDGALGLSEAAFIDCSGLLPALKDCRFTIACDVKNPLFGENGASRVFAPQKGASPDAVIKMDAWARDFAALVKETRPFSDPFAKGAGAAGGLGFALQAFLGGIMQSGAEVLLGRTDIEREISRCDLVITGEGKMDEQTAMGKAPVKIAKLAKKYGRRVIAIVGCVGKGSEKCLEAGIDRIVPALTSPVADRRDLEKETAAGNVSRAACRAMQLTDTEELS